MLDLRYDDELDEKLLEVEHYLSRFGHVDGNGVQAFSLDRIDLEEREAGDPEIEPAYWNIPKGNTSSDTGPFLSA